MRNSLRRSVVIAILFISLVPVLLVGTVSYYRTRAQIQNLVAAQLSQITDSSAKQLEEYSGIRSTALRIWLNRTIFYLPLKHLWTPKLQHLRKQPLFLVFAIN